MPLFKCSASKAKPKNGIAYITDEKKAKIVSVRNLFQDEDYAKQFEETASRFGKGDKFDERKYYHCKLSCARKDNVSPEKAHAYAEELTAKLFQNYECVIATHTDTQTVHSHIIVNAVDPITGKKLQYLICSLALRTANDKNKEKTVFEYIDDITGEGSLNKHFKNNIYASVKTFSEEQLSKIMANSMIPTLKLDEKNRYEYYPQLNVSVFNKKIYQGDLGAYANLPQIIMINEEIIDMSVETVRDDTKPEQYSVNFDEKENVKVRILNDYLSINNEVFEESLCLDLGNISTYQGKIHDKVDGDGWRVLNNSALNNLFSNKNFYYDAGDHILIRNDSVRKTIISKVHGLYIYKEEIISYQGNAVLCDKVIDFLLENKTIGEFKPKSILFLLKYVSDKKAQKVVNSMLLKKEEKEVALYGLDLMERGLVSGWLVTVTKIFLKYASGYQLNLIYQANAELNYSIEQLIKIDADLLTVSHKEQVDKYNADLDAKKKTIIELTGIITTKGLRERAKDLESDETTKKFSKLCNRLIGHVNEGLDDVSLATLEQWHKDALELKEISLIIERRLDEIKN